MIDMERPDADYKPSSRALATVGGALGWIVNQLTNEQIEALAREVEYEVRRGLRGYNEYTMQYVADITASSCNDADRVRKVRSYANLLIEQGR